MRNRQGLSMIEWKASDLDFIVSQVSQEACQTKSFVEDLLKKFSPNVEGTYELKYHSESLDLPQAVKAKVSLGLVIAHQLT